MLKKIIDNYDSWAYQYDSNINPTRDLDKIATIKSLSNLNFFHVLELGCGSGKNTEWLITKADKLVGLDFSKNMLSLAKNKLKNDRVTFINTNINEEWPVDDNLFVLVTISLTLDHIKKLDYIFNSLFMILKKG